MLSEGEILLNKIAQGRVAFTKGLAWFDGQDVAHQSDILAFTLPMLIQQAHPTPQDIARALEKSPLKATMTPMVLFKTLPFSLAMRKVMALPVAEWRKAFVVLLSIFQAADTRRRETECSKGCFHAWHNLA